MSDITQSILHGLPRSVFTTVLNCYFYYLHFAGGDLTFWPVNEPEHEPW